MSASKAQSKATALLSGQSTPQDSASVASTGLSPSPSELMAQHNLSVATQYTPTAPPQIYPAIPPPEVPFQYCFAFQPTPSPLSHETRPSIDQSWLHAPCTTENGTADSSVGMTDLQWEQEQIDAVMSVLLQSTCDFAIEATDMPDTCEEMSSEILHVDPEEPKVCSSAASETKPSLGGDVSIPVHSTIGSQSTPSSVTHLSSPFSDVSRGESIVLSDSASHNVAKALPTSLFPTVPSITIDMEIDTPSVPLEPAAAHPVPIDMIDMAEDLQPTIACAPFLPPPPDAYMAPPTAEATTTTSLPEARHPTTDMNVDASLGLHTLAFYTYRSQPPLLPSSEPLATSFMDVDHESIDDGGFPGPCAPSFDSVMLVLCAAMKAMTLVTDSKSETAHAPMDLSDSVEDVPPIMIVDPHSQADIASNEADVFPAADLAPQDCAEPKEIHVAPQDLGPPLMQPLKTDADKAPCAPNTAPSSASPSRAPSIAKPSAPPLTKSAFRLQSLIKAALAGRLQEMVPKKLQLESVTDFYWDLAKHFSSVGHPLRLPDGSDVEGTLTASEMAFELLDRNGLSYTSFGWQLREVQPSTVHSVPSTPTSPSSTLSSRTGLACTERVSRKPVIRVRTDESLEKSRSSTDATSPPPSSLPDLTTSSDSDSDGSSEGVPSPSRHTEQRSNGPTVKKEIHDTVDGCQWQAMNYNL